MRRTVLAILAILAWGPWITGDAAAQAIGRPLPADKPLTQLKHEVWQSGDGLPQNRVEAIARAANGYLWLGTREGLARFDGSDFVTFDRSRWPNLRHVEITRLLAARDGSLWIGTRGGGLSRLQDGRLQTFGPADGVPGEVIFALYEDTHDRVWIATDGGLVYFAGGRVHPPDAVAALGSTVVVSILQDYDGGFWLGTLTQGLLRAIDGELRRVSEKDGMPAAPVACLGEDTRGIVWAGTANGLVRLRAQRATVMLPGEAVSALEIDGAGTVWAGTQRGLVRIANDRVVDRLEDDTLSDSAVLSLLADAEGSLWIGTRSGGLNRLQDRPMVLYGEREGLKGFAALTVYQDPRGDVWIGTAGGGLFRQTAGGFAQYTAESHGLGGNVITSIVAGRGDLWIGTDGGGVSRLRGGRVDRPIPVSALPSPTIRVLEVDDRGDLWIGTEGGLARYTPGEPLRVFRTEDGLSNNFIRAVFAAHNGAVWVGTNGGGLTVFDGDRVSQIRTKDGLSSDFITSLHVDDEDGAVWVGTFGRGLSRIKGAHRCHVASAQGLADDVVFDIIQDRQAPPHLWMNTSAGIVNAPLDALRAACEGRIARVGSRLFTVSDRGHWVEGSNGQQPASWTARDGRLWFATQRGALVLDPKEVRPLPRPAEVTIEDVSLDGRTVTDARGARELWNGGALRIAWSSPWYRTTPLRFRYRLEGFDEGWTEAGTARSASYTNLPPGEYRFQVLADNGAGRVSTTATVVPVVLRPRLYQTGWFAVACGIAIAALLGTGVLVRSHRGRERERRLTSLVDDRTRALQHEMAERQRAEDERRALDRRIQDSQRLESLGLLAGGIAHDFNNLLVGILGQAGLAQMDLPPESPVRDQVEQIERAAVRAAELTSQLLAYSGRGRFVVEQVRLPELVTEMAKLLETALARHVETVFEMAPDVPAVEADPAQIRQVVMNLLTNASDALADRPGRVTVGVSSVDIPPSASGAPDPRTGLAHGRYVRLIVSDTGIGMDAATLARIFDPFFTTKFTGRGLGLAAVQGIVRSHHGAILVESQPGRGTTFEVYFPAAARQGETADSVQPARQLTARRQQGTVLVVDDDASVRAVGRSTLERAGYAVRLACDGQEAIDRFREDPDGIVCVLLDLTMPKLSGVDTLRALRAIRPDVCVVLTSGFTEEDTALRLDGAPAQGFVKKPWRPEDLVDAVTEAAAHARPPMTVGTEA